MLDLDSPRWAELRQAYGPAREVPRMLRDLADGYTHPLEELWGSICHQGNGVHNASYAAVPHLFRAALREDCAGTRAQILVLIGAIRCAEESGVMALVPDDVREWYVAAIPDALQLTIATLRGATEDDPVVYLLYAAAALDGRYRLAHALEGLASDDLPLNCVDCGCDLYAMPDRDTLTTVCSESMSEANPRRLEVEPGPPPGSPHEADSRWLSELANVPSLAKVRDLVPSLFGTATCPACDASFPLMDRLESNV